jgi:hypothetical protein
MATTALAVRPQLTPEVWGMINSIAPTMKDSRLFGVATPEQAAAIMLKGYELGFGLTASFEFIHVIDQKPTLAPRGALALILNSPLCEGVEIKDEVDKSGAPSGCSVTMKRRGGLTYTARFTLDDAKRAGLVKPGSGWEKYPALMCKWRAVGFAADVVFPDLLNGMKRADELGADLSPDGEVIEGSWTAAPVEQVTEEGSQPSQAAEPDPATYLNGLVKQYGAQAIIDANGGAIPSTMDDLRAVEEKLSNS